MPRFAPLFVLVASACAGSVPPAATPRSATGDESVLPDPPPPEAHGVELEGGQLRVPSRALDRGALTLVGPAGACVAGAVADGATAVVSGCPSEPTPWVALASDAPAKVTLAERADAPSTDAGAPYVGRFGQTGFGFRLESPPGDGLCPGSPSSLIFLHGDPDAMGDGRVLGRTLLEAPVTRSESEGAMALARVDGLWVVVIVYGGDRRRVVTLEGTTLLDVAVSQGEPCGCCDE